MCQSVKSEKMTKEERSAYCLSKKCNHYILYSTRCGALWTGKSSENAGKGEKGAQFAIIHKKRRGFFTSVGYKIWWFFAAKGLKKIQDIDMISNAPVFALLFERGGRKTVIFATVWRRTP